MAIVSRVINCIIGLDKRVHRVPARGCRGTEGWEEKMTSKKLKSI